MLSFFYAQVTFLVYFFLLCHSNRLILYPLDLLTKNFNQSFPHKEKVLL